MEIEAFKKQELDKAKSLVEADKFADATVVLDQLAARLASPAASQPVTEPPKPALLSTYFTKISDWKKAKADAANGVFALKNAILQECDPELLDPVKAKIDQLNSILNVMDDSIVSKIQEAGNEGDPERQLQRNQALAKFAGSVLANLRGDPLASAAENNPF